VFHDNTPEGEKETFSQTEPADSAEDDLIKEVSDTLPRLDMHEYAGQPKDSLRAAGAQRRHELSASPTAPYNMQHK